MITLHRLGHKLELFQLNPDLIVTVEAHPDTVITLATGAKIVVAETPQRVCQTVRAYRVDILAGAMKRSASATGATPACAAAAARRCRPSSRRDAPRRRRGRTRAPDPLTDVCPAMKVSTPADDRVMKAATGIGIAVAIVGILHERDDGRDQSRPRS